MEVKNKSTFILDDNLIDLMTELQTIFQSLLVESRESHLRRDFEKMLENQNIMRNYIITNQNRINFKKPLKLSFGAPNTMPELFGLCMLMVCDLTKIHIIDDIMVQFEVTGESPVFENNDDEREDHCVCTHSCRTNNLWKTTNIQNGNTIILGCDCILKKHIDDGGRITAHKDKMKKKEQALYDYAFLLEMISCDSPIFVFPIIKGKRISGLMEVFDENKKKCNSRQDTIKLIREITDILEIHFVKKNTKLISVINEFRKTVKIRIIKKI